ncbi:AraC family transcriptional regulator [Paenibacillus sp. NEAU-GSW1]|uniref:AraC family transcriptional regulator n=1 Tax=Paenibacillus sp. NEAU-GSW1 TaxID=2682486 RepID=UPI001565E5E6
MEPNIESLLKFGSVNELYIEYVKRQEPFTMTDDHFHDYYEIYYMLSGKRIYFIQDRSYSVEQGDLVFIAKQNVHKTMHAGSTSSHERVIVHFNDSFIAANASDCADLLLLPFTRGIHVLRLPRQEQLAVDQTVRRMLNELQRKPSGYQLVPRAGVIELLLQSSRYLEQHDPPPLHHATPIHAKISDIVRYMNEHFAEPLRLQQLADLFFISPCHLSRTFKEITGFTFSDYLTITRIKEAQRLLRETELAITAIASAAGFDNFSHFGKTFKRLARVSPREYRKQI